jgi:hypothetical protein
MGDVPVAAYDPIFFLHHWYALVLRFKMCVANAFQLT